MIRTGFSALDNLTGGLAERQGYLVYGNAQEAKSALALAFLASGVAGGEGVALVTDRPLEAVVAEGRGYGFDLSEAIHAGKFQFFAYPEGVADSSMQLLDDGRIMDEFQELTRHNEIRRLVFDPVTPLLNAQHPGASAKRFHSIISAVSQMGATAIYLIDSSETTDSVGSVREIAHGVMRLDAAGLASGKIVFERWPGSPSAESLDFGIVAGIGLVSLNRIPNGTAPGLPADPRGAGLNFSPYQIPSTRTSAIGTLAPPGLVQALPAGFSPGLLSGPVSGIEALEAESTQPPPGVLVIHPDPEVRTVVSRCLGEQFDVSEAQGIGSGMAKLSGQGADVLVLAHEMAGACGGALAFKLRQSGYNIPMLVVGSRLRRISDKAKFLRAGVDVVLDFPQDLPLLRLSVDNLLRRAGRLREPLHAGSEAPQMQRRASASCTMDLEYFCERAAEEYARPELAGASPLLVLRMASGKPMVEELSSAAILTARSTDLVYVGSLGVAVLLSESAGAEAFLSRFRRGWAEPGSPRVEYPYAAAGGSVLMHLRQFIREATGQPAAAGRNGKSFQAVAAGHRLESGE